MKRALIIVAVIITVMVAGLAILGMSGSSEHERVRGMQIENIDLMTVADGTHQGDFSYGKRSRLAVEVTVKDHRITDVDVVETPGTKHAKKAEAVLDRVKEAQSLDVDVVSGATTTSKALLKALEDGLRSGVGK